LKTYNSKVKFNLNKIELRIIINYWDIQKEKTILWEDYFGDIINIVSRLQHEVNENKIFATSSVIEKLKEKTNLNNKFSYKYLWETILRWILYKIWVYEVFYDGKENSECTYKKNIILLSPELQKTLKDAGSFVFEYSFLASIIWIQNIIPFWTYIIFPLHLYLLKKVANRFGIFDLKWEIWTIFLTVFYSLISIFLISYLPIYINDLEITWYKLHILIILLNFCFTYVLWKCFVFYFFRKSQWIENINKEIKNMLKKQS
jgi:hypothetical protein